MSEFKKRRPVAMQALDIAKAVAILAVMVALAFFTARGAWNMYGKFSEAAAARTSANTELAELKSRHAIVKAQVEALDSPRGIEAAVRERYGVARPGEGEIDIVRQPPAEQVRTSKPGFFSNLWQMLFVW